MSGRADTRAATRWWPAAAALILLLAVVVPRVIAGYLSADYTFTRGDLNWDTMALNLLDGKGLLITSAGHVHTPMYAHRPPVYALILAGLYGGVGRTALAVVTTQILFAIFATFTLYLLGLRLTGSRLAAWLAALLSALYPALVLQDVPIMETTLFRGLVYLVTLQLLDLGARPTRRGAALLGLTAGVAVLTRTTLLPFLLLSSIWLVFMWGRRSLRLVPVALAGALVFLAVLSPWLIRNAMLFGEVHMITGSGRSLWIGSNERVLRIYPEQSIDVVEYRAWRAVPKAERTRLRALPELEFDRELKDRALADLKAHPERIRPLALRKLGAAFSPRLNPSQSDDTMDQQYSALKVKLHYLTYGPLLLFGIAGLLYLLVRSPSATILILLQYVAFAAVSAVYWAHSRHRYYLDPLLMIAASALLVRVVLWLRARRAPQGDK